MRGRIARVDCCLLLPNMGADSFNAPHGSLSKVEHIGEVCQSEVLLLSLVPAFPVTHLGLLLCSLALPGTYLYCPVSRKISVRLPLNSSATTNHSPLTKHNLEIYHNGFSHRETGRQYDVV